MTEADVQRWLDAYIAAWSSYDPAEIAALFTDDAAYHYDPFREPLVGGAAIAADWLQARMPPGSWEAEYRPFAVEGDRAVAMGETRYPQEGKRYRERLRARVRAPTAAAARSRRCSSREPVR